LAETERRKGLAGAKFKELQTHIRGRSAMTFVRADNAPSPRAHRKMARGIHFKKAKAETLVDELRFWRTPENLLALTQLQH
jgi:hypothetical protein